MIRGFLRAVACLIVVLSFAVIDVKAQQLATLKVTVTDQSGGAIPSANVTVRNLATEAKRTEPANETGLAVIPGLAAGDYELLIEAGQFKPYKGTITLTVGQIASLNVALGITRTEKVEVYATVQGIDTEKSEVSQVIESQKIGDLPIAGRDFIDFVLLTPTANIGRSTAIGAQSPFTETVLQLSFGGLRETHSTFFALDGADYTVSISGVPKVSPSQDWVQEFRVVSSPYTADTGRNLGSVVNTITKSGGKDLHGSIYEFFRNNKLDANNLLSAPGFNTLRFNQFGADAGGPVIQGKSFFFGGYEGQRRAESPIYSAFILHCIDSPCFGPFSINDVKQSLGLSRENLGSILQIDDYDKFIAKSTNLLTDKTSLNIGYLFNDDRKKNARGAGPGQGLPSSFRDNPVLDQTIYGNLLHLFGTKWTSETVLNFGRRTYNLNPVGAGFEPVLEIPNLLQSGGFVGSVHFYREQHFQAAENMSYIRGNHSFKFGGDFEPTWISSQVTLFSPAAAVFSPQSFFGAPPFPPIPGFALVFAFLEPREFFGVQIPQRTLPFESGLYAGPSEAAFLNSTELNFWHRLYSVYGQDQWRARPNLTFTLALRYDVDGMPSARDLRLNGASHPTNYGNVQPRASVAWSFRGGKGVVRAGAGLFTGPFDYSDILVSWVGASEFTYMNQPILPQFANPSQFLIGTGPSGVVGVPSIPPNPAAAFTALSNFSHMGIYPSPTDPLSPLVQFPLGYADRKFNNAYAEQASLEIENQIAPDLFFSAGYQWIHAAKIPVYRSINGIPNGFSPDGVQLFRPADLNFGFVLMVSPIGWSIYNGGTFSLRKNFSHHYSILGNYTYSKSLDISTDVQLDNTPYDYLNPALDKARGDNDVTHRFTLSLLGETPSNWNVVTRNFKLSMLNTLQSARYYTVLVGFDANGDIFPFGDRVGNIGRNTYRGDAFYDTDIRIQKVIPFKERYNAEASFEVFNLFNRPNILDLDHTYANPTFVGPVPKAFGDGITSPFNPTFGTPKFAGPARQLQLSLRINF